VSSDKIRCPQHVLTLSSAIPPNAFDTPIHNLRIAHEAIAAIAASLGGVEGARTERVARSPRAVELIQRFIYSCSPSVIDNLTLLSEGRWSGEKYDVKTARIRLRPPPTEPAETEPLRVYAIAVGSHSGMGGGCFIAYGIGRPPWAHQAVCEFASVLAAECHRFQVILHTNLRKKPLEFCAGTLKPFRRSLPQERKHQ
jgi:hypothetical protein